MLKETGTPNHLTYLLRNLYAGQEAIVRTEPGRSNQSILKEISPKYSLEGLMLKLQYFGHLIGRP